MARKRYNCRKIEFGNKEVCGDEPIYVGDLHYQIIETIICCACGARNRVYAGSPNTTDLSSPDYFVFRCYYCNKLIMEDNKEMIETIKYDGFVEDEGEQVT